MPPLRRAARRLLPLLLGLALIAPPAAAVEDGIAALRAGDAAAAERLWRGQAGGDPAAQFLIGMLYDDGIGRPRDHAEAARWFRAAAERGHAPAQFHLGLLHALGQGVPYDQTQAARWYRAAAEQGFAPAQFNLGLAYASGLGVPMDYAEATRWYRAAADQGYAQDRPTPRQEVFSAFYYRFSQPR